MNDSADAENETERTAESVRSERVATTNNELSSYGDTLRNMADRGLHVFLL